MIQLAFRQNVLDHGWVELHSVMGNDLTIVNAARQSFGQTSTDMGEKEKGLINFLMRERHGTPFEMVVFTFNIKLPIFVMREWVRHRIASINEYSGRYSKMIEDYYIPKDSKIRSQTGKPGAYRFEPVGTFKAKAVQKFMAAVSSVCWNSYEILLKMGIAKEVARMILPVNFYTQITWTINLRSLLNFINLRSADTAMWEIQEYSRAVEWIIHQQIPVTYDSFLKNKRVAP